MVKCESVEHFIAFCNELVCCWLLLPLWESVVVRCFAVRCFMYSLVLNLS